LFGDRPEPEDPIEPEIAPPNLWIENVRELTFEIHCDLEVPVFSDVVLSSNACSFIASCVSQPISSTAIKAETFIELEKMPRYEPFAVFLRTDSKLFSAGTVQFLPQYLISSAPIPRISESYFVSFPPHFRLTEPPLPNIEIADGGVILHVTADSCETFERQLVAAVAHFPDGSNFVRRKKTRFQVQAAKELGRYVQKFLNVLESTPIIEKQVLLDLRASATELLSCVLW
jgi:hypothetical protein